MRFSKHIGLRGAWNMRAGGMLFLLCFCLVLFVLLSLLCYCWPVVDRRLLPFLASPRNGSKRRRRKVAALRVPACASQKMGKVRNSLRSNTNLSNPFSAPHKRQRHMRKANVNTSVVRLSLLSTCMLKHIELRQSAAFDLAFDLGFDLAFDLAFDLGFESAFELAVESAFDLAFDSNSHVALPIVRGGKWIRSEAV
jgi:hypothetical protein